MKFHHVWSCLGLAVILSTPLIAKEGKPQAADAVGQLVRELDDDNYFLRERAQQRLIALGLPAISALGKTLVEGSPEAAWRASAALERIAIDGDELQLRRVAELLKKLSRQKPHLGQLAAELALRQQWVRHQSAVTQLRSLGARVVTVEGEPASHVDFFGIEAAPAVDDLDIEIAEEEMAGDEDLAEAEEDKGIFGAIRAIARAFVPVLPDPEAPPEPIAIEMEAKPLEPDAEEAESPDVEIVARAKPRGEDIEVVEEPELALEVAEVDVELALAEFGLEGVAGLEGDAAQGLSQITLGRNWLGGDEGLAHLKHVKGLTAFTIEDARISDAALKHLAVPTLRQLTLRGGQFTNAALRKWRASNPKVQVWAFGSAMMGVGADMSSAPLALNHIFPHSGAQEAGLAAGDIVKRIDGEEIRDFSDLMLAVYQRKAGDKLKVEFERAGKLRTVEVPLKSRQAVERAAMEDPFR